jgi:hypothetical protein
VNSCGAFSYVKTIRFLQPLWIPNVNLADRFDPTVGHVRRNAVMKGSNARVLFQAGSND